MRKTPQADVLVVGAGVFGLACAWACLRRGLRVTVAEAATPGAGASGGLVGALSPHAPEAWSARKQFQLDALLAAPAHWAAVAAAGGVDPGYARLGRLIPLATGAARARAEARAAGAAALWGGAATWSLAPEGSPGWLDAAAAPHGVVRETLSARVSPRRAVAALAAAVQAEGADLRCGWTALGLEPGAVRFAEGRIPAAAIILATGAAPPLAPGVPGRGVKGQAALLRAHAPPTAPLIYAEGVYVVPQPDGQVAVGSTSEDAWIDARATDDHLERVLAAARALCPALRDAPVVARWGALRPRAARPDPMLGPLPGHPGVYLAAGGFKTGFGLAHAVGAALADMIENHPPPLPPGFTVADHLAAGAARS